LLFQQIAQNKRKTIYVLIGFILFVSLIGAAIGYFYGTWLGGLIVAVVIALVYTLIMVSQSTNVVMTMNHAREVTDANEAPELFHVVEDMALVARVPMPKVYIIDDPSPNAFATGNDPQHSAVAATSGLLEMMNREELEGVIGHEISHVRNYDIRISTIALALTSTISILVNFGMRGLWWGGGNRNRKEGSSAIDLIFMVLSILSIILAPIVATIIQLALSRNREYLADASSVELTRNPHGLISALQKLDSSQPMKNVDSASAALYISDPKKKKRTSHLFDTHPATADRIERLEKM